MKFRTICAVLDEIILETETASTKGKAIEARDMAKRMQKKLDFYALKKGHGKRFVGDTSRQYRWHAKKAKGEWEPI